MTVDPTNDCNYDCVWCNSKAIINKKSKQKGLSRVALEEIAKALSDWKYEGEIRSESCLHSWRRRASFEQRNLDPL